MLPIFNLWKLDDCAGNERIECYCEIHNSMQGELLNPLLYNVESIRREGFFHGE